MIAVGSALWPVAQRAAALEPGGPAGRCAECPTPGVCEARGHDFKIRTYDVESPVSPGESS